MATKTANVGEFIRTKGITQCPPVQLVTSQHTSRIPAADAAQLELYEAARVRRQGKTGWSKFWDNRRGASMVSASAPKVIATLFAAAIALGARQPQADMENAMNTPPPASADHSCYVRGDNGSIRYYLDGPPRDGELAFLQGQPITESTGKVVVRNEAPESDIPPRILRAQPCPPGKHHL
jgi:hypothetical protein